MVNESEKWKVAIKPLVPFICALCVNTLIIIITNIEKIMPTSYTKLKSESDELPSPLK